MVKDYKIRKLNAREETTEKFSIILDYTKPKPTALDLLDHIIDRYVVLEKIPISKLLKHKGMCQIES